MAQFKRNVKMPQQLILVVLVGCAPITLSQQHQHGSPTDRTPYVSQTLDKAPVSSKGKENEGDSGGPSSFQRSQHLNNMS